jgi:hypothetical protein
MRPLNAGVRWRVAKFTVNWELVVAVVATLAAVYAIFQSERHKRAELRPWFAIDKIEHRVEPSGQQRLIASLRHVSGGVALNVRFSIEIGGAKSSETSELAALLPGDQVQVLSPLIAGPPIQADLPIKWNFSFEDEGGRRFALEQTLNLKNKQISYVPSKR